ncbi:MAG TPA: PBP1A family penicillin-binding protein [Candidatus Binatia bacterium]|nr:PBP1A family penicillin-binding protein [Candidatus Binatia bacterium]
MFERIRELQPRHLAGITTALMALFLVGSMVLWQTCGLHGCPEVERLASFQPGGAPVLLDRDGEPFADFAPPERTMVALEDLPPHVADAFVAIEDRRFFDHGGVDWRRVGGAALANVREGGIDQGFSTITMQLARSVFPERLPVEQRTMRRKLLEIRVASEIERAYSKSDILELYLNHIYLGNAVHGVGNAARHYFGIDASELTLPEAATLAALARAPGYYDPRRRPEEARRRRNLVLTMMEKQGHISADQAERARGYALSVVKRARERRTEAGLAPYAVEQIRRTLEADLGEQLYARPLKIFTTIDSRIQRAAEEELRNQLRAIEKGAYGKFEGPLYKPSQRTADGQTAYLQGAIVVMNVHRGDVLAWVGGRDFAQSQFDRAALAQRQAGSAFKPFVYAAALERGYALSQPLEDAPLTMDMPDGSVWTPHNISHRSQGLLPLRAALVHSNNLATVRLAQTVGLEQVAALARRAGVQVEAELPSIALGAVNVSPQDLTAAYTTFAAGGVRVRPRMIDRVETLDGQIIWHSKVRRRQIIDGETAFLINDVLSEAVQRGTGREALPKKVDVPVAGKTGTTNEVADAWFVGYTPELVGGVWVGFDRPRPIVDDTTAGRLAAPVWARVAERVYEGRRTPQRWERPHTVREHWIDPATGLLLRKGCDIGPREPRKELFLAGREPASFCPGKEPLPRNAFVVEMPTELPTDGIVASLVTAWRKLRDEEKDAGAGGTELVGQPATGAGDTEVVVVREATELDARQAKAVRDERDTGAAASEARRASEEPGKKAAGRSAEAVARLARNGDVRVKVLRDNETGEPAREESTQQRIAESEPLRRGAPGSASEPLAREGDSASEPLPRDGKERSAGEPATGSEAGNLNFSGWWGLSTQVDKSAVEAFRGLQLGYRIQLEHNGDRITGRGQKWTENGRALMGAGRTAIMVEGRVRGNEMVLRFREQGSRRTTGGTFALAWAPDGSTLSGTFDSSAASSRGSVRAIRLR